MNYYDTLFKNINPDLFYDTQIVNKSLTWRLATSNGGSEEIVLAGILSDVDTGFSYSVGHDYSGENGGFGVLKTAREGVEKIVSDALGLGRMAEVAAKSIGNANLVNNAVKNTKPGNWISSQRDELNKNIDQTLGDINTRLGTSISRESIKRGAYGKFVSAFDFIKVFQGSSIDINLPTLEVILFDLDGCSIYDTVEELNKKLLGGFSKKVGGEGGLDANFWGIQEAPNDYEPRWNVFDDKEFPGTFSLYLGDKYLITNLIPQGFNVNLSQYTRMGTNNPLYADVTVQMGFASYITREKLGKYLKPMRLNK